MCCNKIKGIETYLKWELCSMLLEYVCWDRIKISGRNSSENVSVRKYINPLSPDFFFLILAHSVFQMWILQEPKKVAYYEYTASWREKSGECAACLEYSVSIFVE
jgi:hypothetical protein